MISQEFHNNIDIELDKSLDYEFPYILPEVKDYWLTKAELRVINQKAFGNNPKKEAFDESVKRIDDLKEIVKTEDLIPIVLSYDIPYSESYSLPTDYLYFYVANARGTRILRNGSILPNYFYGVDLIPRTDAYNYVSKPGVNHRDSDRIKIYIEDRHIVAVHDYYTTEITKLELSYLKKPVGFNYITETTTELQDLANEIIDEAVSMIIENFESQRLQGQVALKTTNE